MAYTHLIFMLGLSAILALPVFGQDEPEQDDKKNSPQIYSQLNLSDDQMREIKKLRFQKRQVVKTREDALKSARRAFRQALRNNADDQALKERFQVLQKARAELSEARFQQMLKLRGVLTEEQQAKFQEIKKARENR
jgi:Spy/CpxP family protein refolding chaperone